MKKNKRITMDYLDICLQALIMAWRQVMEMSIKEALSRTEYGKGDTLALDAIPEIILEKCLTTYNSDIILITEELGKSAKSRILSGPNPERQEPVFFADPTDRSRFFHIFSF